jgi:hypothetical protein
MHDIEHRTAQRHITINTGFGVLTAVVINSSVFWDITPCSAMEVNLALIAACHMLVFHTFLFIPDDEGDILLRNFF